MLLTAKDFENLKNYTVEVGKGKYKLKDNIPNDIIEQLKNLDELSVTTDNGHMITDFE